MDQKERRNYLIRNLIREQRRFHGMEIEQDEAGARRQLRSLMNALEDLDKTEENREIIKNFLHDSV